MRELILILLILTFSCSGCSGDQLEYSDLLRPDSPGYMSLLEKLEIPLDQVKHIRDLVRAKKSFKGSSNV